jgi:hypothetical protein
MGERTSPSARYGQIDEHYAARLATCPPDDDGPIWMVNLMSYRDRAEYPDGRASDISGREADDRYTPLGPLAAIGAEIVFVADVDTQFLNPAPAWHRVAVVKYPTRRSFVEMSTRADFQELHHHKEAGMAHTFVIGCLPMPDVPFAPQDAVDWAAPAEHRRPVCAGDPRAALPPRTERGRDEPLHRPRGQDRRAARGAHLGLAAGRGHDHR